MKITKIKLKDHKGNTGIIVDGIIKKKKKDGTTVYVGDQQKFPLPIPTYLRNSLNRLKIFFLIISGHWNEAWNEFISDMTDKLETTKIDDYEKIVHLTSNLYVTGVYLNNDGIQLIGYLKSVGNKGYSIVCPVITESDIENFQYYEKLDERINELIESVKKYMDQLDVNAKQYILEFGKESEIEELNNMTDEDAENLMIQKLEAKGHVVFKEDETMEGIQDSDIVEDNVEEAKEEEETTILDFKGLPAANDTELNKVKHAEAVEEEW